MSIICVHVYAHGLMDNMASGLCVFSVCAYMCICVCNYLSSIIWLIICHYYRIKVLHEYLLNDCISNVCVRARVQCDSV